MSTSDSSPGQTSSQPSASATTPAGTAPAAAAAGTSAAPASTDSGTTTPAPAAAAATTPTPAATTPAAGETKPAGSETPPAAAATTPPATGAPEKYDFKAPEGDAYKGITLDGEFMGAMAPALKAANLSQAAADALVKTFIDYQQGVPKAMLARDLAVTLKDPDLGGMNWGQTQGYVNEALGAFTTPEFRGKLERWGIANDLEFVRVFAAIGRSMRGDTPLPRNPNTAGEMSLADRIYSRAKKVGNSE